MQNTILTTQEVAKYLKLNEKTVLKMAQSGNLPAVKIANQWRFYLSSIDEYFEYLQDKITRTSNHDLEKVIRTTDIMPLSRLIDLPCINLRLKSDDSYGVLHELAVTARKAKITASTENLVIQLAKREEMLSTAIGGGIAIPHPRNPNDELFTKPAVIIGISRKGIEFVAPDKKRVHLFFMTCAPDVVLHLKLLSKVAILLNTKETFEKFMNAKTENDVIKILLKFERAAIAES